MDNLQHFRRTDYCGTFTAANVGQEISVCGWVQRKRNLGSLIFVDLRDRTGLLQLAFDDSTPRDLFEKAASLRGEYVIAAKGLVRERESKNPELPTGDIEVKVTELRLLAKAATPPFEIVEHSDVRDAVRLKYRYLDLRRPDMQRTIALRHKIVKICRDYFDENGFLEIETPILTKSTPEGARDYLVPSRVHPGKFYALPQSPQQYKQLLMLSGFDRYFQIARCFRDEDLRADRQPEFTQIDLEMSFVNEEDVMTIQEGFLKRVFKEVLDVDLQTPFRRMPWQEAMDRFGSDKPDLRFGYEIFDLSETVKSCGFGVFDGALEQGGTVRGLKIEGGAKFSRKEIDSLTQFVKTYRVKGLAWAKVNENGELSSSFAKFLKPETMEALLEKAGAGKGDLVLIVADADTETALNALGMLRCEVARRMDAIPEGVYKLLWVTDFPLFEYGEDEEGKKRLYAKQHPFTAPKDEDLPLFEQNPIAMRAKAYDIVLNGTELGGGSIRISVPETQEAMFRALGFTDEEAMERFGHLINAFKFGAPPHGGLAYGLDRLVMLMTGADSIRDVIAFPKVQNASEPMTSCPDFVDDKQLDELSLNVTRREETSDEE